MKISNVQYENFLKICKETNEFLFHEIMDVRSNLEEVLASQGYWSGIEFRYYPDGDNWKIEPRQFGF